MSGFEILRYLVIVNAVVLILQTIRLIAAYGATYSLMPRGLHRVLPLYVWLIATSYLIYLCGTTFYLVQQSGPNIATRCVLYGLAGAFGQYALWNLLRNERLGRTATTDRHHLL